MDKLQLWDFGGATNGDDELYFSGLPLCNWQLDYPIFDDVIEAAPLMQDPPDSLFPHTIDFQDEFNSMFDGEIGCLDEIGDETSVNPKKESFVGGNGEKTEEYTDRKVENNREEKVITFEEVSRYFYMPITQAAKELNVGLTLLKKKCRELGIPRWPHRKMKSLQTLIKNVQELTKEDGNEAEAQLRSAIKILEQERKTMEREPSMQLEEKTKRLRQACFKANYKKRRIMELQAPSSSS